MSLLLVLFAFQGSPSLCNEGWGIANFKFLTDCSYAVQADSMKTESKSDDQPSTFEFDATDDVSETKEEEAAEGAEAAAAGAEAEAAEAGAEAAAEGAEAAAAAADAEIEYLLNEYLNSWQVVSIGSTKAHWMVKGADLSSVKKMSKPIWVKSDHSRDKTTKSRTTMRLFQFDCENRRTKDLAITSYGPNGDVLFSEEFSFTSWEYTVPDSVIENVLDAICVD